jgi:hypothetical protein
LIEVDLVAVEILHHDAGIDPRAVEADPFAIVTLDFGIRYERAVLDWFDDLPLRLRSPSSARGHHLPGSNDP